MKTKRAFKSAIIEDVQDIGEILLENSRIRERVGQLAAMICADYSGRELVMIGVLKGAFLFLGDLMREMSIPLTVDFMVVSSYGSSTKSSGVVRILKDLDQDIQDKDVLIVEDIVDTGFTLNYLLKNLRAREPRSLEICTLLRKDGKPKLPIDLKYIGFEIPDRFVVGYGLDYNEAYRQLPDIRLLQGK